MFQPNFQASPRGRIADPDIYRQSFPQKRKAEEAWAMLSGDREFSIKLCRLPYKNFDLQWPNSREKRGFGAHTAGPPADKDPITAAALFFTSGAGKFRFRTVFPLLCAASQPALPICSVRAQCVSFRPVLDIIRRYIKTAMIGRRELSMH